ncbi:hypothetical protein AVEN_253542-1 [Araneus ventricosus]|uniref:Uncharacterized protein n=1 Tax=Araneus ventricosus TaxID=182803 RepID=A0A4Y2BVB5_ARAVE|nr:hypothetical protein AVEN_253542-1 [Araneus ventricosus]
MAHPMLSVCSSLKTNNPLAQDIPNILLNSPNIYLDGLQRMWDVCITCQRISSQRNLPCKGSQYNIHHPGASSKKIFMPSPPNPGRMNGTMVTLEGTSISSFQRSSLPQLCGKVQKSCFQRDMARSQLTLRDLASKQPIDVVTASWETVCTSEPVAILQANFIPPNDLEHLWWKRVLNNPLSRLRQEN